MSSPIDIDGGRFGWRENGGAGDGVLLLHGLGGSRTSWEPQLAGLGTARRLVAWDQPGYGASAPADPPLTFAALADAVADLLDELSIDRAHVVGLSFGGMVAQHAALAHPERVRSLTLLSTSPAFGLDGTTTREAWLAARLSGLEDATPGEIAEPVLTGVAGPGISRAALAGQMAAMARIPAEGLRAAIECLVTHDTRHRLGDIAAPTLVAVGAQDEETPPSYGRALADGIPGARFVTVDGAGHLLNAEAPAEINTLLLEHFDRVEAEA